MPFFIPAIIGSGIAAAVKGAAAAGGALFAKIAAVKAAVIAKSLAASSLAVGAGALSSGLASRSAALQRNQQIAAQIAANRRTAAELEASRNQALENERKSAFQFGRKASVQRGDLIAQLAGLGGVGGSSDLLSSLAASQSLEADIAQSQFQGTMDTFRAQRRELDAQSAALAGTVRSPLADTLTGGIAGGVSTAAGLAARMPLATPKAVGGVSMSPSFVGPPAPKQQFSIGGFPGQQFSIGDFPGQVPKANSGEPIHLLHYAPLKILEMPLDNLSNPTFGRNALDFGRF